jgi:tetratricopeptide (TPR) repeat protein
MFTQCNNDIESLKNQEKIKESDSIYYVHGRKIIDSILPIIEFNLKSGGVLNAKDASIMYLADTNNLDNLLNFSISLYKERYFKKAYWHLNRLLQKDSTYKLEVLFQKALLWDNVPNNDSTLYYFSKAIELSPSTSMLYYYRSMVYDCDSLYEKAIEDIDKAIGLAPKNEKLYITRGTYKISLGDFEGALKDLKKVPEYMKNDYNLYANRAIVC